MCRRLRRSSGRTKTVESPLFPGYVFCRFDKDHRLPILMLPSVVHVVGIGKEPEPIDSAEIASIRLIVDSPFYTEAWPFVNVGEHVRVVAGPLTGAQGVIVGLNSKYQLVASLTLLQRSIAVEIDPSWVQRCEQAPADRARGFLPDCEGRGGESSQSADMACVGV